jgi:hypothetical protein
MTSRSPEKGFLGRRHRHALGVLIVDFLLSVLGAVAGGWLAVRLDGLGARLTAGIGATVLLARIALGAAQTWCSRSAE